MVERAVGPVIERTADRVLDAAVLVLAAGAVAHHAALLLDLRRDALAALWLALTLVLSCGTWRWVPRSTRQNGGGNAVPAPAWGSARWPALPVVLGGAGAAVVLYAVPRSPMWWWVAWALLAGALSLGLAPASFRARSWRNVATSAPETGEGWAHAGAGVVLVLALAAAMAVAALVTDRPDLDDVYVVNRSVHVENHDGEVPTQDTVFSDRDRTGARPPLRSPAFEVLAGIVAAALPVDAASVVYFGVAPLAALLSVLAIWRLVRALDVAPQLTPVAVAAAVAFLILDGSVHGSFGNFHFARMWQGKAVLVAVLVPLLWTYALRWGRDGSKRDLVLLAAANVAAAGVSSTALFVAPIATAIVSGGAVLATRNAARLLAALVATAYPVALAIANRSTDTGLQDTSAPSTTVVAPWLRWTVVFGRPALALVAVALAVAWTTARDRTTRAALAAAPLAVLVVLYGPRWLDPLRTIAPGAGAILWRAMWTMPVPVFVGLAVALAWSHRQLLTTAVIATAAAVFVVTTTPVTSGRNHASIGWPRWRTGGATAVAQHLVDAAGPGALVAGPLEVDRVVPLITSDVWAVDPRPGWYAAGVDPVPRRLVQDVLTEGIASSPAGASPFADAVDRLGVDAVALPSRLARDGVARVLAERGFVHRGTEGQYLLLLKRGPS